MKINISVALDETDKEILGDMEDDEPGVEKNDPDHFPEDFEVEEALRVLTQAAVLKTNKTMMNKVMELCSNRKKVIKSLADVKGRYNELVSKDKDPS